jgi:hypothetical protein
MRSSHLFALLFVVTDGGYCQEPSNAVAIVGTVEDQTGATVPGAIVELRSTSGKRTASVLTDTAGTFRFIDVPAESYDVEIHHDGFTPTRIHVKAGPALLKVTLSVSELHDEVTVNSRGVQLDVDSSENQNAVKLDHELLHDLPTFDQNYLGTVSRLLDPSSIGTTGPTIVVDGLETPEVGVSPSAIQEVKINQNPYSVEYSRPGRGRIEIITEPGSSKFHGTFNFFFRDHALNARNAFAVVNPPEQHRTFEGNVSGPLGHVGRTSFLISASRAEEDIESIVFADTSSGIVRANAPSPRRSTFLSVRLNRKISDTHSLSFRYELKDESMNNQGVGGINLLGTGTEVRDRQDHVYYTDHAALSAALLNDFSLRVGRHYDPVVSESPDQRIIVLDSFSAGGAQVDRVTTENHIQFDDIVAWAHGKHVIKAGINAPDLGRRGLDDRSNSAGTYYFSGLSADLEGRPYLFTLQRGDGHVAFMETVLGGFIQDNIRVTPNFAVTAGLRYDWQNYAPDHYNVSPRIALAWGLGRGGRTVFRAGGGRFYDRTGPDAIGDTLLYDGQHLQSYVLENPGFPIPFGTGDLLAGGVRFQRDLRIPYTIQYSAGLEHRIHKGTTISATYIRTRGVDLFRSRDINAPLPPLYMSRPDPSIGVLREIESAGDLKGDALEIMFRGNIAGLFNGAVQYRLSRTYDNSSGIGAFPANNWDLSGEWSRADSDQRHRLNLLGSIHAKKYFTLGINLSINSGSPYSLTTGLDEYHDGVANSRPSGVPRNSLQGPGYASLDLRWAHDFLLKPSGKDSPTLTLAVDGFNLLNRTNDAGFVGNLSSRFFGHAVVSLPARQLQISFRFKF